ncbi:MAG: TonB-dependent receptor domain-containing protein [bacterium]
MKTKHMKLLAAVCVMAISASAAWAQTGTIRGKVIDDAGNPLPGANVVIEDTYLGAATGLDGDYRIKFVPPGTYTITVTMIGFEQKSSSVQVTVDTPTEVNLTLQETVIQTEGIVVSASRKPEKITDAPATIAVLEARDIRRSAGFVYGEAIAKAKGVDFYRTGVDGIAINARGFMTAFSFRFQTFADNRNSMLPGASVGPGNLLPVAKEDIERLEIIVGPGSALWGPNASNGVLSITTKHPRQSLGTTAVIGSGERSTFIGRFRHAGALNDKIAYKANLEFVRADDFVKNDTAAVTIDPNTGKIVHATLEDPNFNIEHFRFDASLYYSFTPNTELIATYARARVEDIVTTNISRNQVDGWVNDIQQLRLVSPHFFATVYRTGNDAGKTHNINTKAAFIEAGFSEDNAIEAAKFVDESERFNFEAQYNNTFAGFNTILGINYENNQPVSKGTFLADTGNVDITIEQFGLYGQVERELPANFKLVLSGRVDTHDNYETQYSPRVGLLYKVPGFGNFRVTYNQAFQAPAVLNQFLFLPLSPIAGFPLLLRGNNRGFTLADGTEIPRLKPEQSESIEFGYRGLVTDQVFLDFNAYRTRYEDFISPLVLIGNPFSGTNIVKIGNDAFQQAEFTSTYVNFGEVNIQGLDIGVNVQINKHVSVNGSYSFIEARDLFPSKSDTAGGKIFRNDINRDGKVDELSFNAPENKYNFGVTVNDFIRRGTFASLTVRHLDEYDFISGSHRATKAGKGTGAPPFQDRGPLGGFESVDLFFGYNTGRGLGLNVSITNLFDDGQRQFVGSPEIKRLAMFELRYQL